MYEKINTNKKNQGLKIGNKQSQNKCYLKVGNKNYEKNPLKIVERRSKNLQNYMVKFGNE